MTRSFHENFIDFFFPKKISKIMEIISKDTCLN